MGFTSNAIASLRTNRGLIKSHLGSKNYDKKYASIQVKGKNLELTTEASKRAAAAINRDKGILGILLVLILIIAMVIMLI